MSTTLRIDTSELPDEQAARFFLLVAQANRGDVSAMPELVRVLDAVPALAQQLGDMSSLARTAWVQRIAGGQLALAEALLRSSEALRAELTQAGDGPLERLLIERAVTCHLHVEYVDGAYANKFGQLDPEWDDAHQRRIDRSQRRFLQAVRTLAQVRRLALSVPVAAPASKILPKIRTVA